MIIDPMNSFINKPACPSCGTHIHWGITTSFDKKKQAEVCNVCKIILNKE